MTCVNQQVTSCGRQRISIIKGLSLISVICAHCNSVPQDSNSFSTACSYLLSNLGTVGVLCFFVISGFLFHCEDKRTFFCKKMASLVMPWMFGSIVVYLYVALRKPPIVLNGLINFTIGNGSYFYYLTILMLFYITFSLLPFLKKTFFLVVLIILGTISGLLFSDSLVFYPTPYLNPFNWIGYFAFGILIRNNFTLFARLFEKILKFRFLIYIGYAAIVFCQIISSKGGYYFGISMFYAWCGALALILLATDIQKFNSNWLKRILQNSGNNSLFFYIWHMPIAGIVANIFSYRPLIMTVIIRPFVVFAIVFTAAHVLTIVTKKHKKIAMLIGLK